MTQIAQMTGGAASPSKGWLKPMFPITGKAHFFNQEKGMTAITNQGRAYFWRSLCGVETISTKKMPMFEPGNWDRCKRCAKQLTKGCTA